MWIPRKVLALGAHTDDYEIGAAATMHRLVQSGCDVRTMAFSIARESLRPEFPQDVLVHECRASARRIGLRDEAVRILDIPVRRFPEHRQAILEALVAEKRDFSPDLVLVHSTEDIHQDHQVVAAEAVRAFKHSTILGYELPWNNLTFSAQCLLEIGEEDLRGKEEALRSYASQGHRTYADPEVFRGLARVRGACCGTRYAEAFQVIRWVIPCP